MLAPGQNKHKKASPLVPEEDSGTSEAQVVELLHLLTDNLRQTVAEKLAPRKAKSDALVNAGKFSNTAYLSLSN